MNIRKGLFEYSISGKNLRWNNSVIFDVRESGEPKVGQADQLGKRDTRQNLKKIFVMAQIDKVEDSPRVQRQQR
jgi:hypothetical protein